MPSLRVPRSMLFVPASKPHMFEKAASSAADAICVDLEDSVADSEKPSARAHAIEAFRSFDYGPRLRLLRINALDTPFAYRDLVDVIEAAGDRIDLVMVPKVGAARDIVFVDMLLAQIAASAPLRGASARGPGQGGIGIEAQIESAAGFLNIREIAAASPRLDALIFGPGDYAASMRMPSAGIGELDQHDEAYPGHRWHAVMHTIVAAARTHGLRCMDGPFAAFRDEPGLLQSSRTARALGFDGKQCIHPAQLPVVNRLFGPTAAEIAHARAVVDAWERAIASGQGAVVHEGRMIDAASLRMARTVLDRQQP